VKAGDIVKVRVVEVDLQRKRIALSRRLEVSVNEQRGGGRDDRGGSGDNRGYRDDRGPRSNAPRGAGGGRDFNRGGGGGGAKPSAPASNGAMAGALAEAFARAKRDG
jgi:protein Tex